jgi:hypothetical protein
MQQPPHGLASTSPRARLLWSLAENAGVRFGREDSFKMSHGKLLAQRFMLGIPTHGLGAQRILDWSERLGMPQRMREDFAAHLPAANLVFLGLEEDAHEAVFKIYLEFWDKVRERVLRTGQNHPLLLHKGYKWCSGDADGRIALYTCFPRLGTQEILRAMASIHSPGIDQRARDPALAIVRRAAAASPRAMFIYVEVAEENNPRKSFDINLYKSGLLLADIRPELEALAQYFGLCTRAWQSLLQDTATLPLGHLSGGLDRDGREFITVYYETLAIDP